jgi:Na+/H+ antiporter NhaA
MHFDPHTTIEALKPYFPPFLGAALGVVMAKGKPLKLRMITFAVGFSTAVFGGSAIASYWNVTDIHIVNGIAFTMGMFGMTIVEAGYEQIPTMLKSLSERLVGLIGGAK